MRMSPRHQLRSQQSSSRTGAAGRPATRQPTSHRFLNHSRARGLAWFSIDYRLTPTSTHDDQLEDLRDAIRFVRAQHARFNIDPARLFLLGESASGQMVAQVATEDRSLAGVISFYGVYDFNAMVTDASPRSLLGTSVPPE